MPTCSISWLNITSIRSPELRENILAFYGDPAAPIATKKKPAAWEKTQNELEKLRALPNSPAPAGKASATLSPEDPEIEEVVLEN